MLIATENINKMNKAAVAMFVGDICWLLYIGYGTHFVIAEHQIDFLSYLSNHTVSNSPGKSLLPVPFSSSTSVMWLRLSCSCSAQ